MLLRLTLALLPLILAVSCVTETSQPPQARLDCEDALEARLSCGTCGNICPSRTTCQEGECVCDTGAALCNRDCVDLNTSREHCGACGEDCGEGIECVDGRCACPEGRISCGSGCVDTRSHAEHCGECGSACPVGARCVGSACQCRATDTMCGDVCADLSSNPQHCGGCEQPCLTGGVCVDGVCGCDRNDIECGDACINTTRDDANCGTCGFACPEDQNCIQGECGECPEGTTACEGECMVFDSDPAHCGACNQACEGGSICESGQCVCPPDAPATCDGVCTDTNFDAQHCNGCGLSCQLGWSCCKGECTREQCPCFEETLRPEVQTLPVDIIWFIDTSGSMHEERAQVEANLNAFSQIISQSGIDYRIIVIGDDSVCIEPPLGGGGCPDTDTGRYRHVRTFVDSVNGLNRIVDDYPLYQDFLRPNSRAHIVAVTDDNAHQTPLGFLGEMAQLNNPGFTYGFVFHSLVAYGRLRHVGCCGVHGCGARIGQAYLDLSNMTGGLTEPICTGDWGNLFDELAAHIISSILPCRFDLPDLGEGLSLDPSWTRVSLNRPDEPSEALPRVGGVGDCTGEGWFFDDPEAPTQIILCPLTCGLSEADVSLDIGFCYDDSKEPG